MTSKPTVPTIPPGQQLAQPIDMATAGKVADQVAQGSTFQRYLHDKGDNTIRRHDAALHVFSLYLRDVGIGDAPDRYALLRKPEAWHDVSYGLVEGYTLWLLGKGYAVRTVNMHLSTLRVFSRLAAQAGKLDPAAASAIAGIRGYRFAQGKRIDERRPQVRKSSEKIAPNFLTPAQVRRLKHQPDTVQGRRDALLVCLLVDHGLRVGEAALLTIEAVDQSDPARWLLAFERPKTNRTDVHELTKDTRDALERFLRILGRNTGPLLAATASSGRLTHAGMTESGIARRVRYLGKEMLGIVNLGPHDLRHTFAELARKGGTSADRLQEAGGWESADMVRRYTERGKIANEGVVFFGRDG